MEHCKKMKWSGVFKNSKWFARTLRRISSCELKGFVYYDLDRKKTYKHATHFIKMLNQRQLPEDGSYRTRKREK